jgi:hypothetical protein
MDGGGVGGGGNSSNSNNYLQSKLLFVKFSLQMCQPGSRVESLLSCVTLESLVSRMGATTQGISKASRLRLPQLIN